MQTKALSCPTCGAPAPTNMRPDLPFACTACGSTLVVTDLVLADQIRCEQCNTLNDDIGSVCSKCGSTLKDGCPFCYTLNRIDHNKCSHCGVNLVAARQRKRSWLAARRRHEAEAEEAARESRQKKQQAEIQRHITDLREPENHGMAIYCLHRIGPEAVEALVETLQKDDDPDARYGAAKALGLIGDKLAVPALVKALTDDEPAVRYWSLDALGKLHAKKEVAAIAKLLRDKHEGVRTHAATVLEEIGTPAAKEQLERNKRRWWPF